MASLNHCLISFQCPMKPLFLIKGFKPKPAPLLILPEPNNAHLVACWAPALQCFARQGNRTTDPVVESNNSRRSANYKPDIWKGDFLKSLKSDYTEDVYNGRKDKLMKEVKHLIETRNKDEMVSILARLELINDLERLGLGYLFETEIKFALDFMASTMGDYDNNELIFINVQKNDDLHATALCFRLLRQHGYKVSQEVFKRFMDQEGNFMACHQNDVKGMLSLFEASNLAVDGENIMEQAKAFTSRYLKADRTEMSLKSYPLVELVDHSLQLPLHLRAPRLEARWYIDQYERRDDANNLLLELAKLDFNLVQSIHQEDLIETWKWWSDLGLADNLSFSRDRPVECFFFTMGLFPEPQFRDIRKEITKLICLIITIDDVYDIYGTLDELELFTDAIKRWETGAISQLPHYMKMCFLALYNTINQTAYDTLKEKNCDILPYLKKAWVDLCEAFLVEAKWYHRGYIPTFEEYMNNALISAGGPLIILYAYALIGRQEITTEGLNCFLESKSNLIRGASIVVRLTDDLATFMAEMQRGDVPKSIQCYMHETEASEEVAREYIKHYLDEAWKKINDELHIDSGYPRSLIISAINLARMSECVFLYGDVLGVQVREAEAQVITFLVEPI